AEKKFAQIVGGAQKKVQIAWTVGHECPGFDKIAHTEDRWQPRANGKRDDTRTIGNHQRVDRNVKRVCLSLNPLDSRSDVVRPPNFEWCNFETECARGF